MALPAKFSIQEIIPMKPFYVSLKPFLNHGVLQRPFDWHNEFGNQNAIEVEIGFGNGEYLARISKENPEVNFIGFEEYCQRISRSLRKLSRTQLNNVRVMRLDARAGFERYIKPRTISLVHCLYPPPWPAKSDTKHRLFTTAFLRLVNSRLVDGGVLKIVTDFQPYAQWVLEQLPGSGFDIDFKKISASYGTKFEKKWYDEGKREFYELFLKKTQHQDIPVREDSPVQMHILERFNPDKFNFDEYSKDGVAVAFRDFLYDAKRQVAQVHLLACDGLLTQDVRVLISHTDKGWRVQLAQGSLLMPTQAIAQAVDCVYAEALKTC